jgi:hypothetical protein
MERLVVLMFVEGIMFEMEPPNSLFSIDASGFPHYVMRVFLSARPSRARVPESSVAKLFRACGWRFV